MNVKDYLSRYHNLIVEISRKRDYIFFCRERSSIIPGPSYGDDVPKSPNRNREAPFVKWKLKAIDAESELARMEKEACKVKFEIESTIAGLEDESLQMILVLRYIDWMTWGRISRRLNWSVATIKRRHDEALVLLDQSIPEN